MHVEPSVAQIHSRVRMYSGAIAAGYALAGGVITLIGWTAGIHRLTDWWGLGLTMKPNAAVGSVVLGLALLLLASHQRWIVLIRSLGLFAAAIGGLTLFEHITQWNVGIDTLLFDEPHGSRGTASPGRMGLPTAACLLCLGTAVALLTCAGRARYIAVALALFALSLGTLTLTGYLYDAEAMFAIPRLTGVAIQTAIIAVVVSLGVVVLGAPQVLELLLEKSTAGMIARRAVPVAFLVPLGIGWLRNAGQRAGLYDFAFGAALRSVVEMVILTGLLWWTLQVIRARDIQQRRADERQTTLISELQHRVKNTLALVRAVAAKTIAGSDSVDDLAERLMGRIDSLSRTQALLTRAPGSAIDLEQLIRHELSSQSEEQHLLINGAAVSVSPKTAEVLLLAIHELATNASKYGALSHPDGRINIEWALSRVDGQQWLRLQWKEMSSSGSPNVSQPRRTGFGTELITRRIPYELYGRSAISYPPPGLCCTIEFPLRKGDGILQTKP
jgi:two-component sensor histidine kinase